MLKKILVLSLVLTSLLSLVGLFPHFVKAANGSQAVRKIVTVPAGETLNQNMYINAGEQVEIAGDVTGDVYIAGGQVIVSGNVAGDVLAAGGTINVSGEIGQNLRVAGGQVTVSGSVGRNLTIVGGNLNLLKTAKVGGSVAVAGGNILLEAPITGDLYAASGNLTLDSQVGGNAYLYSDSIQFLSNTNIAGNLDYYSSNTISESQGATVSGTTMQHPLPTSAQLNVPSSQQAKQDILKFRASFKIYSFIVALIFGLLFIKLFPNYLAFLSDEINSRFLRSLGIGLLGIIITPLILLLLLITIVGVPFALIAGFFYFLYIYLTKMYISYWVGDKLLGKWTKGMNKYLMFFIGLLIYYIVTSIPILGGLVSLVSLFVGFGATLVVCKQLYKKGLQAKVY